MNHYTKGLQCMKLALVMVGLVWSLAAAGAQAAVLYPNEPLRGELAAPHEMHSFWIPSGVPTEVTLESFTFDAFLVILGPSGKIVAQNDDGGRGLNSSIAWRAEQAGWHTAVVTSPGGTGRGIYTLELLQEPEYILSGADVRGSLRSGVRVLEADTWQTGRLGLQEGVLVPVRYSFLGRAGEATHIMVGSSDFDTTLQLLDPMGNELAFNDDSGWTTDSTIVADLPVDGTYTVVVESLYSGAEGSFQIRRRSMAWEYIYSGRLTRENRIDGEIARDYEWNLEAGDVVVVLLEADFDAYLSVVDAHGDILMADDDSGGGTNAMLTFEAETEGIYRFRVSSFMGDAIGEYVVKFGLRKP